ncbi:MAG: VTT domain-containing protein [Nanoarchaeota archaeon]|jgi:uncharacterized membrane protein YdjX (TVP38/TMEM64 family)|nr:VTT domain-containing protein [Nanoarchaeota archaeon]
MAKLSHIKDYVALLVIISFIAIAAWFVYSYFSHGFIFGLFQEDSSVIINELSKVGIWAFLIFILLIIMECVFAPFPPLVIYIAGGIFFGGFIAGSLALVGNILGAAIAFKISHHYGKEKIASRIPKKTQERFDRISRKHGPLAIFILRFNPITSSDLFSYLAGLSKMKFSKFLLATTLGLIPTIYLQTYLGSSIQANPFLATLSMLVGVLYFVLFIVGYFWIKKKNK